MKKVYLITDGLKTSAQPWIVMGKALSPYSGWYLMIQRHKYNMVFVGKRAIFRGAYCRNHKSERTILNLRNVMELPWSEIMTYINTGYEIKNGIEPE